MLCYSMLFYAMLCYSMPFYAILCYSGYAILCQVGELQHRLHDQSATLTLNEFQTTVRQQVDTVHVCDYLISS